MEKNKTLYLGSPDGKDFWLSDIKPEFGKEGNIIRPLTFSCGHPLISQINIRPKPNEFLEIKLDYCMVYNKNGVKHA